MNTKMYTVLIAMAMATGLATMFLSKGQSSPIPSHVEASFEAWTVQNSKTYTSPNEKLFRLGVYYANVLKIVALNASADHTSKLNHFADMTSAEFKIKMNGFRFSSTSKPSGPAHSFTANPTSVDWRNTAGVVSPVKNQGQCGSCWAFSAIEALESARVIVGKQTLETLSPQQLVDCSTSYGNNGCNGGLMDNAFKYIIDKGIESEASYPYKGVDGTCAYNAADVVQNTLTAYADVTVKNSNALETAVAAQPVSVAVDAQSWQFYHKGILSKFCGTQLDHGVVAVGYGVAGGKKFWLVRNSWTTQWGEDGYIRVLKKDRNGAGTCGILLAASRPTAF